MQTYKFIPSSFILGAYKNTTSPMDMLAERASPLLTAREVNCFVMLLQGEPATSPTEL